MDHPLRLAATRLPARSWRTAALLAAGVAAVELVLLVAAGAALLAGSGSSGRATAATTAPRAARPMPATSRSRRGKRHAVAPLARRRVGVVVLNGNGRQGAAAAAARRVRRHGYRIRSVGNAARMDYGRSIVMFRPGFEAEGRRLAHDLGVRLVGPLDGLRPPQLHGAQAVFIVGA